MTRPEAAAKIAGIQVEVTLGITPKDLTPFWLILNRELDLGERDIFKGIAKNAVGTGAWENFSIGGSTSHAAIQIVHVPAVAFTEQQCDQVEDALVEAFEVYLRKLDTTDKTLHDLDAHIADLGLKRYERD